MRQRVMIAMALACNPSLLIDEEPTTALDVTIQAQILKLMRDMQKKMGTSIILITHDLGVVAGMCDRIIVMKEGEIVEQGAQQKKFCKCPTSAYPEIIECLTKLHEKATKRDCYYSAVSIDINR